jgi:acetyltransferase/esterase
LLQSAEHCADSGDTLKGDAMDTASDLIHVNGTALYHTRQGEGPAIVLVPGGTLDARFHADVAALLADEFTVVAYDRRANSRSPRPAGWSSTTIAEQARDLAGLIQGLQLAPAVVWGSSVGAVIALDLLTRHPALFAGVIAHEPPLYSVLPTPGEELRQLAAGVRAAMREDGPRAALEWHARQELGEVFDRLDPRLREAMYANAEVFLTVEMPGFASSLPDTETLAEALSAAPVPLRVVAGSQGRGGPLYTAAQWVADRAGVPLDELPGGHIPHLIEPAGTADLIRGLAHEATGSRTAP